MVVTVSGKGRNETPFNLGDATGEFQAEEEKKKAQMSSGFRHKLCLRHPMSALHHAVFAPSQCLPLC